jgi:hypothetical protein
VQVAAACCDLLLGTRTSWACCRPRSKTRRTDNPLDRLPAAFDAKLAVIREAAGDRFENIEINAFGTFVITDKRRAETQDLILRRGWTGIDVEAVWQMPTIFIGSLNQIRADLHARRERFGLSYLIVGEDSLPALAKIIAGL